MHKVEKENNFTTSAVSKRPKSLLYSICLGHSGSTLLGNVIGSHPKAMHIGEFIAPMQRKIPISCQFCDNDCVLWGGILKEPFLNEVYKNFLAYSKDGKRKRKLKKILKLYQFGTLYDPIFKAFPSKNIIVDSSKKIEWARFNSNSQEYEIKYIFLYRDIRAVWASLIRKYRYSDQGYGALSALKNSYLNIQNFFKQIDEDQKISIIYEDFVTKPEENSKKICNFLNLDFTPEMLTFYNKPHHTLGANQSALLQNKKQYNKQIDHIFENLNDSDKGYYSADMSGFVLDERWKKELRHNDLKLFEEIFKNVIFPF